MNEAPLESLVENARVLVERFGRWPSFHDAEVTHVALDRSDQRLTLRIKVAEISRELDQQGHFVMANPALVELTFSGVEDVELHGFNQQNVLFDLGFTKLGNRVRVSIDSVFGLGGEFTCDRAQVVRVEPLTGW
jgi:PAS domain-containing protein